MNLEELENDLKRLNISPDAYCLSGGFPSEAYTIEHSPYGVWEVYYSERGLKTGLKTFDNEHDACQYFRDEYLSELIEYNRR